MNRRSRAGLLLVSFCVILAVAPVFAGDGRLRRAVEPVKDRYLVKLNGQIQRAEVRAAAAHLGAAFAASVDFVFENSIAGFSATMNEGQAEALARHPWVDFVEEVAFAHPSSDQPLPIDNSLYNLDRIDQSTIAWDHHYYYCERQATSSLTSWVWA